MKEEEYLFILNKGSDAWNDWRKQNPDIVPDLRGVNLSKAQLKGVNLSGVRLDEANLSWTSLVQANLNDATLTNADLRFADLSQATIHDAKLIKADLRSANLSYANLHDANLRYANLAETNLRKADLRYSDLSEANLLAADLRDADLNGAILIGTILREAKLAGALGITEDKMNQLISGETTFESNMSEIVTRSGQLIENLKRHIVQIESLLLVVIFFQILLSLQQSMQNVLGPTISFLVPFVLLALTPIFVRVTNPESRLRSILTFGMSGAGFGGLVGSSIVGALHGSIGGPAGALIGAGVGLVAGAIAGPFVDGVGKKVLTQGEAREYLIKMRNKFPALSLEEILAATESPSKRSDCKIHMFSIDGIIKCTKEDVIKWLRSECWKST